MRKYELNPIAAIVSSSYWMRFFVDCGTSWPQRSVTPCHVMWARYCVSSVKPSGSGKFGSRASPKSIVRSARSAIHSVLSHASGTSRNR